MGFPPTRLLYQEDSYLREFKARVLGAVDGLIVLDATAFHPGPHGGLDTDKGFLVKGEERFRVEEAKMLPGGVVGHRVVGEGLEHGDEVIGVIDWDRRYRMMKLHTFSHILAAILYNEYQVLVTGGHITPEYARDDFSLDRSDWKEVLAKAVEEANEIASRCLEVKVYWLPREEALKIPGLVKLADKLPPEVEKLRIVEIPGVDVQADGGPHVRNTCEIGRVKMIRMESRGKRRKRLYYTLEEGG
ncbi:MAG: alanyl-tRNA editing protein [Desulfurococcales archaeon]|nr:alanyl-tRNA editing protein [Desulfurococcales archaeon]